MSYVVTLCLLLAVAGTSLAERTIIMLKKNTVVSEEVFIHGGRDDGSAIPISHVCDSSYATSYNVWKVNDLKLDWGLEEKTQAIYKDPNRHNATYRPKGTPTWWTTSDPSNDAFHYANKFGEGYWIVELDMDCTVLPSGWFQMKGVQGDKDNWHHYYIGKYVGSVHTNEALEGAQGWCDGSAGGKHPFSSDMLNHAGKCGKMNVFEWNKPGCLINEVPTQPSYYKCARC
ncbi:PREDICTED: alpha-amylase-like [Priapulus caudatus]|uniref:Alpha-amylase-like n=1 Tax=Priapulus caudatus TaxID=37621 RepID=A0ABM1ERZ1_PRICU|nr:PREDICTED: alpha-amylase-like [Priapulus caudatus]XP_014674962.1 PREDICTED: alpha-amylase-like [Priapulus caudatus]XP_014674963.1 PREDICTED: alpha-amylase-like [Priapulus caudatus]XP_014674964.1 PREDICTED: alpha-amylase-like [Priapulus caudatus]XP_014674965.1 PREDICTED: alpha-amylase-like [Priapulus caudatus]